VAGEDPPLECRIAEILVAIVFEVTELGVPGDKNSSNPEGPDNAHKTSLF
jgi:hypothetical protein